ncbi:Acetyl-CoA hydrolase/transferase [Syntrophomonas zehnderi OL-4]|uniref:Acetyl-CoA hydrolase/transferase n=1 Tax=Syntrophomonas zehnderi OL-4 TaxID=690567 RepID=A0A0E4C8D3_9FIRM|nr:acetyl-CoA hydrolase/transferase C-terminal domain-containing protein [Syntrophomonas zehnderi]CFX42841.1 Acetyl-CoA hydrolase/transferase [Syntrophomonas zehnderi OL-4]
MTDNNLKNTYRQKLISFEEAAQKVKSGDFVATALGLGSCSIDFFEAVLDRYEELHDVKLSDSVQLRPCRLYDPVFMNNIKDHIQYVPAFGLATIREIYGSNCDYLVNNLSDSGAKMIQRTDVFICQVTPPDSRGYMNLGLSNDYSLEMLENRRVGPLRLAIGEVNDQMPVVYGKNWVHISDFDYLIEHSSAPPTFKRNPPSEIETTIAAYVLELINDGDTIQMGLGGITESVFAGLENKRGLGVHSEMLPMGLPRMVEEGIIDNKNKPFDRGISVGTFCLGDEEMYEYVSENPAVEIHPGYYVNKAPLIARIPNMLAVNNALMIDFSGQITAEGLGHRMISGSGGQLDFVLGSFWSEGGKSVTVMRSARQGADGQLTSSIVPGLPTGTPVTVPRTFANYVVTEYGITDLRNKTRQERAHALINIAHPELRSELRWQLQKAFY